MSKAKGGNQQSGRENGSMPSGNMAMRGHNQGDMSPSVKDYQKPTDDFSQEGFSKTLDYIERQDKRQSGMSKGINKQSYVGRYS